MPRFNYSAIDQNKKTVKGTVTAESPYAARKHLRNKGLHPTNIKEAKGAAGGKNITLFKKRNVAQVADFTKQLSTMLGAEIKLTEALSVLIQQVSDVNLKSTVTDIRDRVVSGESFADALGDHEEYFDIIYVSMMRIGEVTGTLPNSLFTVATFMEKRQKAASKLITAMIYPMIILCVCLGAIIILTIKVIPQIAEQITKAGQELPMITKALIAFSNILTSWKLFVLLGAIALVIFAAKKFFATEKGAYLRDKTVLSLPVFGPLLKQRIVARFASTLSTLLGSGLSVADSLKVVADVTGNSIMTKAVKKARDRILSGADIATPLKESGVIDPTVAHMVSVGEKSGELEKMLKIISENLESSSDVVIERLSAALEPLIIVVMAVIVGIIVFATVLPLLKFSAGQV